MKLCILLGEAEIHNSAYWSASDILNNTKD